MLITFPGVSAIDLGRGYDFFQAELKAGNPFADDSQASPAQPGQNVTFFAQLVEDSQSVRKVLDVSAQAEFGFGVYSGNASASYSRLLDVDSYSLYIVGKVTVELEKSGYSGGAMNDIRIAPDILQWFKGPDDLPSFRERFGDYFVSGVIRGGALLFVVEIETASKSDKQSASASLRAKGGTWSVSMDLKASIESLSQQRRVTARIAQFGGEWGFKTIEADSLLEEALAFPTSAAARPATVAVELSRYDAIQNWPGSIRNYTPVLEIEGAVRDFQTWHSAFGDLGRDINYIRNEPQSFAEPDLSALAGLAEEVEDQQKALADALRELVAQPIEKAAFTPSLIVDNDPRQIRKLLPAWRKDLPKSARDILALNPESPDGDYDVWLRGDPRKRTRLFCKMTGNPREYLRLLQPNSSMNRADPVNWIGSDVVNKWQYVRLDPDTLEVDLEDFEGAISNGGACKPGSPPFATAGQCGQTKAEFSYACVDLEGTDFKFHRSVSFGSLGSYSDNSSLTFLNDVKATFAVRGWCSQWGPLVAGTRRLVLEYDPERARAARMYSTQAAKAVSAPAL